MYEKKKEDIILSWFYSPVKKVREPLLFFTSLHNQFTESSYNEGAP